MPVNTIDDLKKCLLDERQIIIYGAGENTHWLFHWIKDDAVLCNKKMTVAVSRLSDDKYFHGLKIHEIKDLVYLSKKAIVLIATFSGYFPAIEATLRGYGFKKNIPIKESIIDSIYSDLWKKPIVWNKILVENFHGLGFGDSPRYVAEKLLNSKTDLDIVWGVKPEENKNFPVGIRTVEIYTKEYFEETATAHVWISNVRKFHNIRKRQGQFYIQTWHGFPLKKIEGSVALAAKREINAYYDAGKKDSAMLDLLISNSVVLTDIYRDCFWFDGPIVLTGFPRNDIFFMENAKIRSRLIREYGIGNKKIALYAPTFRKSYDKNPYDLNLRRVVDAFNHTGGEWVLFVRLHPNIRYMVKEIAFSDSVIDATGYCDMAELLVASDALITDYSSSMFDYMYSKRPIYLYANDIKEYESDDRGFNIPYRSLPFLIAETEKELIHLIQDYDGEVYRIRLDEFIRKNRFMDDGMASQRVTDIILKEMEMA